jgi:hypothetical protein
MGQSSQEAGKKGPSAKSLNELMELLLKLNAKLREKISPRRRKEDGGTGNTEMMIIIFNTSSEDSPRAPRVEKGKPKPLRGDWIDDLCEEIEDGSGSKKKS